jgi:hypothetical protein
LNADPEKHARNNKITGTLRLLQIMISRFADAGKTLTELTEEKQAF